MTPRLPHPAAAYLECVSALAASLKRYYLKVVPARYGARMCHAVITSSPAAPAPSVQI